MDESSAMGDGSCQDESIVYAKIHPSIGIARVGNSRQADGFYIGPQVVDPAPLPAQNYRDGTGALTPTARALTARLSVCQRSACNHTSALNFGGTGLSTQFPLGTA